jgi:hypothetical protein
VWISRPGHLLARLDLTGGQTTTVLSGLPLGVRGLRLRYSGTGSVAPSGLVRTTVTVR